MDVAPVPPVRPVLTVVSPVPPSLPERRVVGAEVLAVDGPTVLLRLGGLEVRALSTVPLAVGERLRLLVAQATAERVLLQVLPNGPSEAAGAARDLAGWLDEVGLPVTPLFQGLVRAFLARRLPLDPLDLLDLGQRLSAWGLTTAGDLEAAADLVSRGLPVTPATLAIARPRPGEPLAALAALWRLLAGAGARPEAAAGAHGRALLDLLTRLIADGEERPDPVWLRWAAETLGTAPEARLARALSDPARLADREHDLVVLLRRLAATLAADGPKRSDLAGLVERARQALEQQHLENAGRLQAETPALVLPLPAPWAPGAAAWVRVEWEEPAEAAGAASSAPLTLTLEVDPPSLGRLQVQVQVRGRRLALVVRCATPAVQQFVAGRLDELVAALEGLGYTVHSRRCDLLAPARAGEEMEPVQRRVDERA